MSLRRRPPVGNVRRVTAIGQNMRGVMTNKAGRVVQFESFLERSLLLRLDRDPTAQDYGSQPETLQFSDDQGNPRTYTPDFIVWRHDGSVEIHEVTLTSRRSRPAAHLREAAAAAVCKRRGWQYIVHTESDLPQDTELANLLALFHYRPWVYAHTVIVQAIDECLANGQPVTTDQIIHQLITESGLPQANIISTLCHMLWHGRLETNLHQPIFVQQAMSPRMNLWLAPAEVSS